MLTMNIKEAWLKYLQMYKLYAIALKKGCDKK